MTILFLLLGIIVISINSSIYAHEDKAGCKDHQLLSRMPNFYISSCKETTYDSHVFYDEKKNKHVIEGHKWEFDYRLKRGYEPPGALKVSRNYTNAIKKIGGTILKEDKIHPYMKVEKGGKEIWIEVHIIYPNGSAYYLRTVEKTTMAQEVVADAESLAQDINSTGHAAVYGIYFDFDKAEVKPESDPALKEIANLLKNHFELKLFVVGHTDSVGDFEYNIKLSQARADAVVKTLREKHGVSQGRLKPHGIGPLSPVASNDNEEGRGLNRRVEIVKK